MALSRDDNELGAILIARGQLSVAQLTEAEILADKWAVDLLHVLQAKQWVSTIDVYRAISDHYRLPLVDLVQDRADDSLIKAADYKVMHATQTIPISVENGIITVATAQPGPAILLHILETYGNEAKIVLARPFDVDWWLQRALREDESHDAVWALAEHDPTLSAKTVATVPQLVFLYVVLSILIAGFVFAPFGTFIALNALLTIFYTGNFLFKAVLVWAGGDAQLASAEAITAEARLMHDRDLPIYTVLVPMFREPEVLPILTNALRNLDYPLAKLDIKIVLEEGDAETIEAAQNLGLESVFEIIRVPASHPQTKPKACNYALRYARGEYLVIFDAEDKPEPDQLKKVLAAFRQSPDNTACVQCRLNYYNARENWLTRMFTLDYSLWFDLMLPGLERLGIPIPLGGTSNHFRIDVLRELHAWDPFNVTEDADLGIRLTQKGYRVRVIDSTTFEEANVSIPNWIRQRSRWIKGYMQTFLVHTRRPIHLFRTIGFAGVLGFVFFIGGTFLTGLLNPIFWAIFTAWLVAGGLGLGAFFPPVIMGFAIINLLIGNGLLIYLMMIAPVRRNWGDLAPWGLSVIGYWVLMTIASYKALWQLVANPFYWEKTQHGLSKHTATELAQAKSGQTE